MIRRPPRSTLCPYTTLSRPALKILARRDCDVTGAHRLRARPRRKVQRLSFERGELLPAREEVLDRKSTRLNSSHANISYAVFCLKKKTTLHRAPTSGGNGNR